MKRLEERHSGGLLLLYRVLVAMVAFLLLVLAAGTVYGCVRGRSGRGSGGRGGAGSGKAAGLPANEAIFTALGRLRVPAAAGSQASGTQAAHSPAAGSQAAPSPATLVVSVVFPYNRSDQAFTEELASRTADFKRIAAEYFGSHTAEELRTLDEAGAKAELLQRFNAILRLGRIGDIYFNDYMILD